MADQPPRELAAKAVLSTLNGLIPGAASGPTFVEVTYEHTRLGRPGHDSWSSDAEGFAERLALVLDVAVLQPLFTRITELEALTAAATEWRLWEGGYGLYVRRGVGIAEFAITEAHVRAMRGRRAWTPGGWQFASLLAEPELYCWPDGPTAVARARKLLDSEGTTDGITRHMAPTQALQDPSDEDGEG
ncbi:hypothetical protein ACFUIY_14610 [Streptomyces griseorubiginosus]|uniref:hypothetical protein n=1 Tax=Streptomyces griseorubiginosus TaxID=67304 RepID=UPI00364553D1